MSPDVRIDVEEIQRVLVDEVIKRDVLEGEKAVEAKRRLSKSAAKTLRRSEKEEDAPAQIEPSMPAIPPAPASPG